MRLHPRLGAVTAATAAAATVATLFVGAAAAYADDEGPVDAGVTVHKIDGLPADFINGVDVSTVLSQEESGVVYRDFDGNPADLFDVLADAGINYVRVRVWNNPYNEDGDGYGAGNVDVTRATEIGQRATAAGMKVLVDFHYSDFWADPGKQKAPKAWAGLSVADTATAVHDFTAEALEAMQTAGVDVGMVQVGNETNNGVAGVTGMANMVQVFAAGSDAVHDVYGTGTEAPLVALHFANPESGSYPGYASALNTAGVDYDVFASSYYPYWHGSLSNLTATLSDIAGTYDKKVMVAETSWAYTLDDGDGTTNTITESTDTSMYPVSVQGQATEIRDVMDAVNDVPDDAGVGVFYWEPAWIPVPGDAFDRETAWETFGSGWATAAASEYDPGAPTDAAAGSGWDNQALFDYNGNPLESLLAFTYARTGATTAVAVASVEKPKVSFTEGEAISLPASVQVTYNDDSTANVPVTWDDVLSWIESPGTYKVNGVTADGDTTVVTITVKKKNYLVDGDFEAGGFAGWSQSGTDPWPGTYWVYESGANAHGTYAINVWNETAYSFTFHQQVTGLTPGDYTFTGQFHGDGLSGSVYATTSTGTVNSAVIAASGYLQWKAPTLTVTVPADGVVTLGFNGTGAANGWGWLDDFELADPVPASADRTELQSLVAQATSITRSAFSSESLAALDSALEVARIVLAGDTASEDNVAGATALLGSALAGLETEGGIPAATVSPVAITVEEGNDVVLPSTVTVTLYNGSTEQRSVEWSAAANYIDGVGTYRVTGSVEGGLIAKAKVVVTARNFVFNGSFEDATLGLGWVVDGDAGYGISATGDAADGANAINLWSDGGAHAYTVTQVVSNLAAGDYVLSAVSQGGGVPVGDTAAIFTSTAGGEIRTPVHFEGGWQQWATTKTGPITVAAGDDLSVGAWFDLSAGVWGTLDNFRLVRVPGVIDKTAFDAALAAAKGVDTSRYEQPGVDELKVAIEAAGVLNAAKGPSQDTVDGVTELLEDAVAKLDLIDVPFTTAPTPTITGAAKYGSTLTASAGTWVPTPSGLAYQWKRNGADIAGANGTTYKAGLSDIGKQITVSVTATKADYITATKTSAAVTIAKATFSSQPKPKVSGKPVAGSKFTVVVGTWSPKPDSVTYQWYRDGKAISGQKGKTYTVKASDLKHKIAVKVTASRSGYTTASKTSASVTVVKRFFSTGYASITGTAKVGKTLTGHRGLWFPAPTGYHFQWYRNGAAIPGADNVTYKLTSKDKGKKVTVKVTVKRSGYLSTTVTSSAVTVK